MTNRKNKRWIYLTHFTPILSITIVLIIACMYLNPSSYKMVEAAAKKSYTVTTKSKPYKNNFTKYSTYNNKTNHYYMLRSYFELLEEQGGGTLNLSKGTYVVTNTLYVPSNVTVVLKPGAVIKKGNDTGTKALQPSKSLLQFIAPSKSSKVSVATKYNGEKNITIKGGKGSAIDLDYSKDTTGIIIGHSQDITIEGLTFKNMFNGSFIKVAATKDLLIRNNTFMNHKDSDSNTREAIGIELPDSVTNSFNYSWSKNDKTVSMDITIEDNTFKNLERAIGSIKYTDKKYHKNIRISSNTISKTDSSAIRVLNWDSPIISGNEFTNITNKDKNLKVILVSGAINPTISQNSFTSSDRAIQIMPAKNTNNGSKYPITYNTISSVNKEDMLTNVLKDMAEHYIRYNKTYEEFTLDTEKWDIVDTNQKNFALSADSQTYNNYFTNFSTYNKTTKQYYVLRSYLEQLERTGGGTLTLTKGTYEITNTLYVPSNVTIILEDGVIIRKTELKGDTELNNSKSIFQLASPTNSKIAGYYGGHNGEKNIHFIGKGNATIDLNFVEDSLGIVMGHNSNVSIKGITFTNMFSGHFLEVDAAKDVLIENNKFLESKPSKGGIKEGINLDTPDDITKGFNVIWTNYDKTPNKNIVIRNNTFNNLERAIGTHKYSEEKYHESIQIINNKISNTSSDAIRILNWSNPTIKDNVIENVRGTDDRAILISGVKNPMITNNTFKNSPRPIQIMSWKNTDTGAVYAVTDNTVSSENISLMLKNYLVNVSETFIRINKTYNVFDSNTEKLQYSYEYISYN